MSNFLFRPISDAISRTLSASTRSSHMENDVDVKDAVVDDVAMQEDGERRSDGAARAGAVDTTATTNTVSPPADESIENATCMEEEKTSEYKVLDSKEVASIHIANVKQEELPPPRKRRRKQSEVEKLKTSEEINGDNDKAMKDTESTNESRQIGKFKGLISLSKLDAVTPSPHRNQKAVQTLNVLSLDQENVARLPRKRNHLTSERSGETAAPRRTLPRRQATLQTQADGPFVFDLDDDDEEEEDKKPAAVKKAPKRRRKKPTLVQVKLSSDEEEESSSGENDELSWDEALYESDGEEFNESDDPLSGEGLKIEELAGEWSDIEKLFFLYGLKVHGEGKWSKISRHVRSRSSAQVKWYGQNFFRRKRKRKDIFAPLEGKEIMLEALSKEEQKNSTPWSEGENLLFLYGLKKLGKGRWSEIHERFLYSRDRHQIRNQHRKLLKVVEREKRNGSAFTPLKGYKRLIERLLEARDAVMIPAPSTDIEDGGFSKPESEGTGIKLKPKKKSKLSNSSAPAAMSYDADTVERLALAEVESSSPEAAFRFCIGTLKCWYAEVEELLEYYNQGVGVSSDFISLRDGIAKLWCVLVRLTTTVLVPPTTQVQGQPKNTEEQRVALLLLDIARSCPFVGNHHEVIQARVNLEVNEYAFSDGDDGIAEAVDNVIIRGESVLKALTFSIDICNDAVRKSPLCNSFSLKILKDNVSRVAGQYCPWISTSIMKLGECVAFIRSLWQFPEHVVTDRTSASSLTREANRLSRIKESLLKSGVSFDLDTEYGCDCGCWSVFKNKNELVEHQTTCRGQAIARGEHEKFAWKKINKYCSTRTNFGNGALYNQMHLLPKLESESMNSNGGTKRWNVPRLNCLEVEYGCGRGCSSVFATKQEVLDHQRTCVDYPSSWGSGTPKKASAPPMVNTSRTNGEYIN